MMAAAANDNRFSPETENLRDAIDAIEEHAYDLLPADFEEVARLARKLTEMVKS